MAQLQRTVNSYLLMLFLHALSPNIQGNNEFLEF